MGNYYQTGGGIHSVGWNHYSWNGFKDWSLFLPIKTKSFVSDNMNSASKWWGSRHWRSCSTWERTNWTNKSPRSIQRRSFNTSSKGSKYIYTTFKEAREQWAEEGERGWTCSSQCHVTCTGAQVCLSQSDTHTHTHDNQGLSQKTSKALLYLTVQISCFTSEPQDQDPFPSSGSNQQVWLNWSWICWKQLWFDPLHGFIFNNALSPPVATSLPHHPPV